MMNIGLFAVALAGLIATVAFKDKLGEPLGPNLVVFFFSGAFLNMALALFNMLPVPPLDGARILANISPAYARVWNREDAQMIAVFAFIAVFVFGGRYVFGIAAQITNFAAAIGLDLIGKPIP